MPCLDLELRLESIEETAYQVPQVLIRLGKGERKRGDHYDIYEFWQNTVRPFRELLMSKSIEDSISPRPISPKIRSGPNRVWCLSVVFIVMVLPLAGCLGWFVLGAQRNCWLSPSGANLQVLVSACENPTLISISPDGRYVLYSVIPEGTNDYQRRILDLSTGESMFDSGCGDLWLGTTKRFAFTRDEHALVVSAEVCALEGGTHTILQWVPKIHDTMTLRPDGQYVFNPQGTMYRNENNQWVFSDEVKIWFGQAEHVYYIPQRDWAIALGKDPKSHPERSVLLSIPDIRYSDDAKAVIQFLKDNQISFQEVSLSNSSLTSHNRRFVFKPFECPGRICLQIIESTDPNQPEQEARGTVLAEYEYWKGWWQTSYPNVFAWVYDDSAVVFQLSRVAPFSSPGPVQPILRLGIPLAKITPSPRLTP